MTMNGVDVASWEPGIDFSKLPADFVIVKATEGTWYQNPEFQSQVDGTMSTNRLLGFYHFANTGSSMSDQAAYFVAKVQPYIGSATLWLDWESTAASQLSPSDARKFIDEVRRLTGVTCGIYMNKSCANSHDWSCCKDLVLWGAQYATDDDQWGYLDNPWQSSQEWGAWGTNVGILQYSESGRLDGFDGGIDLNIAYFDSAKWSEMASTTGGEYTPPDTPEYRAQVAINAERKNFGWQTTAPTGYDSEDCETDVVAVWQQALNDNYGCELDVDGYIGNATKAAIDGHPVQLGTEGLEALCARCALGLNGHDIEFTDRFDKQAVDALNVHTQYYDVRRDGVIDGSVALTLLKLADATTNDESADGSFSGPVSNEIYQGEDVRADVIGIMHHLVTHDGDDGHGYTWGNRWGNGGYEDIQVNGHTFRIAKGDRDCSSGVISAYEAAGVSCGGATYTGDMVEKMTSTGNFRYHPWDDDYQVRPGDVVLNQQHHVAMVMNDSFDLMQFSINENGGVYGGKQGDQTGSESNIHTWYDYPWDCCLELLCGDNESGSGDDSTPEPAPEPTPVVTPDDDVDPRYDGSERNKKAQRELVEDRRNYFGWIDDRAIDGIAGEDTQTDVVAVIQQSLNDDFPEPPTLDVDGYIGEQTKACMDYHPIYAGCGSFRALAVKYSLCFNGYDEDLSNWDFTESDADNLKSHCKWYPQVRQDGVCDGDVLCTLLPLAQV